MFKLYLLFQIALLIPCSVDVNEYNLLCKRLQWIIVMSVTMSLRDITLRVSLELNDSNSIIETNVHNYKTEMSEKFLKST